ncbi:MAG TPA: outer membrane beta-barrel protein [Anaeromyxobacteraceae bacterium]|nr:outer membrane beta-barrel protein [Anaeromyxobacteraceae bacterium]
MKKLLAAFVSIAALASADAALAQAPGAHQHDGFYLNLDLGFGAMSSSTTSLGSDLKLSGAAGEFSVAAGFALTNNFIIAGQVWGTSVSDPTLEVDGVDLGSADATLSLTGVGLNLVYYFMPLNLYLSATPSLAMLSLESGGLTYDTENGFGLRFAVGKEWWVSDNWAIGLNGQIAFTSNDDAGSTWTTRWFGVAFSATYD